MGRSAATEGSDENRGSSAVFRTMRLVVALLMAGTMTAPFYTKAVFDLVRGVVKNAIPSEIRLKADLAKQEGATQTIEGAMESVLEHPSGYSEEKRAVVKSLDVATKKLNLYSEALSNPLLSDLDDTQKRLVHGELKALESYRQRLLNRLKVLEGEIAREQADFEKLQREAEEALDEIRKSKFTLVTDYARSTIRGTETGNRSAFEDFAWKEIELEEKGLPEFLYPEGDSESEYLSLEMLRDEVKRILK
jgi:hypothetical protein